LKYFGCESFALLKEFYSNLQAFFIFALQLKEVKKKCIKVQRFTKKLNIGKFKIIIIFGTFANLNQSEVRIKISIWTFEY
jgi:hypothetical protein